MRKRNITLKTIVAFEGFKRRYRPLHTHFYFKNFVGMPAAVRSPLLSFAIMMFSMMLSKRVSTRVLVQAFSTRSNGVVGRAGFLTASSNHIHRQFSSARGVAAEVDEDLDSALDSLLGDAIKSVEGRESREPHMKDSKPVPPKLVETVDPTDFNNPKFLSTSNPRWVEAGLSQAVIDVLSAKGITRFTPVQGEAFDPILAGRDVIGRSRTGTGKTLAFGLPTLARLSKWMDEKGYRDESGRMVRGRPVSMVVLCPTRELARQVQEELAAVARPLGLYTDVFHGGVSYEPQTRTLRQGVDIVVGTPGRIIDHIDRGNLKLDHCDVVVLDEADEMLNMGFADDVEVILDGVGQANGKKAQCLLFSATTPPWVKTIGKKYQGDVISIDATAEQGGARVATTVRHLAIQFPPGPDAKRALLEDIIAVEISKDMKGVGEESDDESDDDEPVNVIAAAAAERKKKDRNTMQQKIFGKTIVFTETKREADELVSGGTFKSLTAQALHGDVGQKQRDATLAAFRAGAFNVLVATDVAARGIDISDVDLVVQFDPPRDVDTYVHRSGRTGRAGKKGVSVLLFGRNQQRDIVRIERDLGHGFKFDLAGPPSMEAALRAAAKTSAVACSGISDETSKHFKDAAKALLEEGDSPEDVIARCLAAISRRSTEIQSRSLITGEAGLATVEMSNSKGRPVSPGDVMFTVGKLARMSRNEGDMTFDSDVGKIQANAETGVAIFDLGVEDAKRLVEFSKNIDAGGATFSILEELEIERDRNFGRPAGGGGRFDRNGRGGPPGQRGGNFRSSSQGGSRNGSQGGSRNGYQGGGGGGYQGQRRENRWSNHENRGGNRSGEGGGGGGRRNEGGNPRYNSGGGGNAGKYNSNKSGNDGW